VDPAVVTRVKLAVLPLILSLPVPASTLPPEVEGSITAAVQEELRETGAPGAAVAVIREGALVYQHVFGVRSIDDPVPVTPDTLFRLGSTTKMMTALVALDAAARGRLDLDAPIGTYAPDLHAALRKRTLRQLLTHTAGMAEGSPSVQSLDDAGLATLVRGLKEDALFAPPGEVFSYTGPGYWLAGHVLERVLGKPYAEVMRERLFEPLGMRRSTLRPLVALTHPLAQGHEGQEPLSVVRPMAENPAQYPAGSVFSSVRELTDFALAVLGKEGPLAPQAVRALFTADVPLPGGGGARYGYGLVAYEIAGSPVFEHGGVRRGYGAHLRFLPGRAGAVILLTNRNGVTLRKTLDRITRDVFDLREEPEPDPVPASLTVIEARRYTGTYVHGALARFTVLWDGGRLVLRTEEERPLVLRRGETFLTEDGQAVTFVFRAGEERARYLHQDLLTAVRSGS
jgi:CubicO group peptidase (beta-lactamase class C family)